MNERNEDRSKCLDFASWERWSPLDKKGCAHTILRQRRETNKTEAVVARKRGLLGLFPAEVMRLVAITLYAQLARQLGRDEISKKKKDHDHDHDHDHDITWSWSRSCYEFL